MAVVRAADRRHLSGLTTDGRQPRRSLPPPPPTIRTGTRAGGSTSRSPERDVIGFVYYFHDIRTGTSGGAAPAIWDPSGEQTYDCLFYDWRWTQPPTGTLQYADFVLPNSLRHVVVEPMRRYRLSYSELGLDLDLEWTALMAPHVLGSAWAEHCHFDQPGRMRGYRDTRR